NFVKWEHMKKNLSKLISKIGDLFFQFQAKTQFFEREFLKKCGLYDLTPNEVKVLYIIGTSNTKSMTEIANALKVTRGTLSISVDSLVKKGYVIRTRHKQDRRVIILYLKKNALKIIFQYEKFFESLFLTLLNDLEDEKAFALEEILKKLNQIIETDFYEIVDLTSEEEAEYYSEEIDENEEIL
ncbi:MAG: MarR family transcriptional regulator, partial [Bacilli bacterium]|nr:MarR family transcriptional regulator [Bacilli bacterium]